MMKKLFPFLVAAALIALFFNQIFAEDIEKKLTLSFSINNLTTVDEVRSGADYRAYYMIGESLIAVRADPRPDYAANNVMKIRDSFEAKVGASYGFNSWFLIQADVGYSKSDIENLEVSVRFPDAIDPEAEQLFEDKNEHLFRLYLLPVGTMTRVPIQTSAIIRFRPKSNFNPYIGAGVGYILVEFKPSTELNDFSRRIDGSTGVFRDARLSSYVARDLGPVTIEAPNSLEYHFVGGIDYTFRKHWSVYMDARYMFASKRMKLKIDDVEKFGIGMPNGRVEDWDIIPPIEGQPYIITSGGAFDFNGDGVLDGGMYYANGGSLKYGGFSVGIGVKYTF